MSEGAPRLALYSTLDIRVRAVRAVIDCGMTITDVAQAYSTDRSTIHRWLKRFEAEGESGLERKPVSGRPKLLARLNANALVQWC